jgi:hypothetical protein
MLVRLLEEGINNIFEKEIETTTALLFIIRQNSICEGKCYPNRILAEMNKTAPIS